MEGGKLREKPSPQDFTKETMKVNPPLFPRAVDPERAPPERASPVEDPVYPHVILDRDDFYDSGIFISPSDMSPEIEPREAETNLELSDSQEASTHHSCLDSDLRSPRHVPAFKNTCDEELFSSEIEKSRTQTSTIQGLMNPDADRTNFDSLSAGPPVLDLTKLMMQPVRASPSPPARKRSVLKSVLPESLLQKVTDVVKGKTKAGFDLLMSKINSTELSHKSGPVEFTEVECCLSLGSDSSDSEVLVRPERVGGQSREGERQAPVESIPIPTEVDTRIIDIDLDVVETCAKTVERRARKDKKKTNKRKSSVDDEVDREDDVTAKREKKMRPNYFVAIQVTNPQVW